MQRRQPDRRTSAWARTRRSPAPSRTTSAARSSSSRTRSPNDPQDFAFTAGGGLTPASFSLDDDADATLSNTPDVHERRAGLGYSLVGDACRAAGRSPPPPAATAARVEHQRRARRDGHLHVLNSKRGRIVVVKDAQPNDAAGLLLHGRRRAAPDELPARRRLRRDAVQHAHVHDVPGRRLLAVARPCPAAGTRRARHATTAARSRTSTSPPARRSPAPSRTGSAGQIVIVKDAVPDDPQDFRSRPAAGCSRPASQLDDDADATLSNTRTFTTSSPGAGYSVSETVPSGWDQPARRAATAARRRTSTSAPARPSPAPS